MTLNYTDLLGFLMLPGGKPEDMKEMLENVRAAHRGRLRLVHVTTAHPLVQGTEAAAAAHTRFVNVASDTGVYSMVRNRADASMMMSEHAPRVGVIAGLQGTPINPEDGPLKVQVHTLMRAGIRVMGLAYDGATPYGCGWREEMQREDMGLTDNGRELIEAMKTHGMILDLAHAGATTALDAARYAKRVDCPVMVSHTGCREVYKHYRNLPDDVLRAVADAGGVVGIYLLTFGLHAESNHVDTFTGHIQHAFHVMGEEHVAVGTDGCVGGYPNPTKWRANVEEMTAKLDPDGTFGARWPDQCNEPRDLVAPTRLGAIRQTLQRAFMSKMTVHDNGRLEARVARIMGGNAARFFEDNLPRTA